MSHIDEGLMHAHLDGALESDERARWRDAEAHLEVCDDCRRRLDEARELRTAAGALLAGAAAAPSEAGPRPEFAALVAAAERREGAGDGARDPERPAGGSSGEAGGTPRRPRAGVARGPWWRSPARLAWAASLVMAAGAGWIGRQITLEQGVDPLTAPAVSEAGDRAADLDRDPRAEGRRVTPDGAAVQRRPAAMRAREEQPAGERALADEIEDPGADGTDAARAPAEPAPRPAAEAPLRAPAERVAEGAGEAEAEAAGGDAGRQAEAFEPDAAAAEKGAAAEDAAAGQAVSPVQPSALEAVGTRCFGRSAPDDAAEGRPGEIDTLRLEPDGTARARAEDGVLVGFWEAAGEAVLRVRLSAGAGWRELRVRQTGAGLEGDVDLRAVACPAADGRSGAD